MPSRTLMVSVVLGAVIVALLIGSGLFMSRGAHLELKGRIQKERTGALDATHAVLVLDFRVTNPSDLPFVVKSVDVFLIDSRGQEVKGQYVAEADARPLFQAVPALGDKFNPTLVMREKIVSKQTVDRMVATPFDLPGAGVEARRCVVSKIQDP